MRSAWREKCGRRTPAAPSRSDDFCVRHVVCPAEPAHPGLQVEVNEAVAARHPFEQKVLHASRAMMPDGTVVDW